jgi:hypothetical protein
MMRLFIMALLLLLQSPSQQSNAQNVASHSNDRTTGSAQYDPRSDRLYRWYMRATIIGVGGGFVGIALLTWQAILSRNNVNALVAGQRAWVMVDIELEPEGMVVTESGNDRTYNVQVVMKYRNDGQTPAWITERRASLIGIADNLIPAQPDLTGSEIIAQGTVPLAVGHRHGYGQVSTPLGCTAIATPDCMYLIYGVVRYRTAFNGTGKTTFGYRVTRGWDRLERLDGWPEWNENT